MSDPRTRRSTHVRVNLTLEVDTNGSWGSSCTLDQAYDQGRQEAEGAVEIMIQEHMKRRHSLCRIRLVDPVKVITVISEREKP